MKTAQLAAIKYLELQARYIHPDGKFDKQGRWYPSQPCSCYLKESNPFSRN